jgi:hypothetical protein
MLEKLFPKTMGPVLAAMRAGEERSRRAQGQQIKERGFRTWFAVRAHAYPLASQFTLFCAWVLIAVACFMFIGWLNPSSPVWAMLIGLLLEILMFISLVRLYQLVPKSPITDEQRWTISSNDLLSTSGSIEKARFALYIAREDLKGFDGLTQLLLHTLLIGALVNASISNDFMDALFSGNFQCAWSHSYVGTISLFLIPFATFARILFVLGPNHWISRLDRELASIAIGLSSKHSKARQTPR